VSLRLPIADAPRPDTALATDGVRPAVPGLVLSVVPAGGLESALAFAEHLVRALRVGGLVPDAWIVERAPLGRSGASAEAGGALATRLTSAGAEKVVAVDVDATEASRLRAALLAAGATPLVVVGADVPLVVEPTLTLAVTLGRPPTTWSASVRASRPTWDGEVVEPRSELARGVASAALGRREPPLRRG